MYLLSMKTTQFNVHSMIIRAIFQVFLWFTISFKVGCAGASKGVSLHRGESPPCVNCVLPGERKMQVLADSSYREVSPILLERELLEGRVGWVPLENVKFKEEASCDFCHSASSDAFAFEWNSGMEKLIPKIFPQAQSVVLVPGGEVENTDGSWFESQIKVFKQSSLAQEEFYRQRPIHGVVYFRPISQEKKEAVTALGRFYNLDYLVLALQGRFHIRPRMGRQGGFRTAVVWTIWDAKTGSLLFLQHADLVVRMTSRHPPDKGWTEPILTRVEEEWNKVRRERLRLLKEEAP